MTKKRTYLDNNATTPIDPRVVEKMTEVLYKSPCNPSSVHFHGQEAKKILLAARQNVANFIGVKTGEIVFTSSGTESMNLLIQGSIPDSSCHIIGSSVDHAAVFETLQMLERKGYSVTFLSPGLYGAPEPEALKVAIRKDTKLIVLSAVNSETGVKLDLNGIAKVAKEANIPLLVDGVALLGKECFTIPDGIVGMGFSGHKIHGPTGTGFIFVRSGWKLKPLFFGGKQESKLRPGTENLSGIVGLSHAITLLKEEIETSISHMKNLRNRFESKLREQVSITINGKGPRICNTSNLCFTNIDGESLLIQLDMEGIAASHASACSAGALEVSRVLLNMGIPKKEAGSSLRFSFSRMNTEAEVDFAVETLTKIINSHITSKEK